MTTSTKFPASSFSLVVLAAGLGSRFGGHKPLAGFGPHNITLLELNIFNAYQAGCRHVVLIIAPQTQQVFNEHFAQKLPSDLTIEYAEQRLDDLPNDKVIAQRAKPLGTAHALWSCRHLIKNGFVVTNGDDYYGASAFNIAAQHFSANPSQWAIVAYELEKTLSPHGGVNRGLCQQNNDNTLRCVNECYEIQQSPQGVIGQQEGEAISLPTNQLVSMNFWCLAPAIFDNLTTFIANFVDTASATDECQLPDVIAQALTTEKVAVYRSQSQWFGLTYADDKTWVREQLMQLTSAEQAFYSQK